VVAAKKEPRQPRWLKFLARGSRNTPVRKFEVPAVEPAAQPQPEPAPVSVPHHVAPAPLAFAAPQPAPEPEPEPVETVEQEQENVVIELERAHEPVVPAPAPAASADGDVGVAFRALIEHLKHLGELANDLGRAVERQPEQDGADDEIRPAATR
jgi:hypothetical protein